MEKNLGSLPLPHPVSPPALKPSNPQLHPPCFQPFQTHPFPCSRARPRACAGCTANPHLGHLAALELPPQPRCLISRQQVTLNLLVMRMTMAWPSFHHKGDPQKCVIPTLLWRSRRCCVGGKPFCVPGSRAGCREPPCPWAGSAPAKGTASRGRLAETTLGHIDFSWLPA